MKCLGAGHAVWMCLSELGSTGWVKEQQAFQRESLAAGLLFPGALIKHFHFGR